VSDVATRAASSTARSTVAHASTGTYWRITDCQITVSSPPMTLAGPQQRAVQHRGPAGLVGLDDARHARSDRVSLAIPHAIEGRTVDVTRAHGHGVAPTAPEAERDASASPAACRASRGRNH
jgi:hypothetical protein